MTNDNPMLPGQEGPVPPKHGIMEELNFPPQLISFVRQNARNIQIGLAAIVVIVLFVLGMDTYHNSMSRKSNDLLVQSMQAEDINSRISQLQQLYDKHPGSDAAVLSLLELADYAKEAGNPEEALERYQLAADEISSNSPLVPLILLAKGQILETSGKLEEAFSVYKELASMTGFAYLGKTGQARIYELQENQQAAVEIFNELKNDQTISPQVREWLGVKSSLTTTGSSEKE